MAAVTRAVGSAAPETQEYVTRQLVRRHAGPTWHKVAPQTTSRAMPATECQRAIDGRAATGGDREVRLSDRAANYDAVYGSAAQPLTRHLTEIDLARRWRMSERTLQSWRCKKVGPQYVKVMGRVLYRLGDIETFEIEHLRGGTR